MSARQRGPRPGEAQKKLTPTVEPLAVGDTPTPEPPKSGSSGVRTSPRPRAGSDGKPKFQRLVRAETRLWPEQATRLSDLRRRVAADRADKSERITDATLIRVAVDLLMAHQDQLQGDTEDQLRASVLGTAE